MRWRAVVAWPTTAWDAIIAELQIFACTWPYPLDCCHPIPVMDPIFELVVFHVAGSSCACACEP